MIGFKNLASLICMTPRGGLSFAQTDGGESAFTVDMLAKAVKCKKLSGEKNTEIKNLTNDSRRVVKGAAFFAVSGANTDGNLYIEEAAHRGAVAIISERPAPGKYFPCAWIEVENISMAMAMASKAFYENPDEHLDIFAVTGTNGKTSVTWLVQHILNDMQEKCGLIGTIQYDLGGRCLPAARTTPQALETYAMLHQMRRAKCKAAAIEISSHAIAQKRVEGLAIDCACFTNLTQDHIDYHLDMQSYFETKASLFTGGHAPLPKNAAINFDDPKGVEIASRIDKKNTKVISFSIENPDADIRAKDLELNPQSSSFTLVYPNGEAKVELKLPGRYNVSNALAAFACLYSKGYDLSMAAAALKSFKGVPGRMQKVSSNAPFDIFVDYAHTDDALKNGLEMLREVVKGKILVVFGCGGKRDRTKRPKMTAVVQKYADIAWATSDNPRGEDINTIFGDMKSGVSDPSKIAFVEDRRRAINLAIDAASAGDCILIAGKGHEAFQELGDTIIPFDDKRVAEELLTVKGLS